jgi:hypothetical protein
LWSYNHIILLTNKTIIEYQALICQLKGREKMRKTKEFVLLSALINRKTTCKFIRSCNLYTNASYTCTHTGGSYCGKYRKLSLPAENAVLQNRHLIEIPQ